jgi:dipeptidase
VITGKLASTDGSVMATHSNVSHCDYFLMCILLFFSDQDGGGTTDPRLVQVPARNYPEGSMRPIFPSPENYPRYVGKEKLVPEYFPENCQAGQGYCDSSVPIGYIPQVAHTFAYKEATYGVMNEKQVAIGESTCSGVYAALPKHQGGHALLSVDELSYIAMERASTAREAGPPLALQQFTRDSDMHYIQPITRQLPTPICLPDLSHLTISL